LSISSEAFSIGDFDLFVYKTGKGDLELYLVFIEVFCELFLVKGVGVDRIGKIGRLAGLASETCFEGDKDESCTLFKGISDLSIALVKATGIRPDLPSRKVLFLNRETKLFEAIISD
jgi:hypothetical protein